MATLRAHITALRAVPELLSPKAWNTLAEIAAALACPPWKRLQVLFTPGLVRQSPLETTLFRLWFLPG